MQAELQDIVRTHYPPPQYTVGPLETTRHLNVVRIRDNTGKSMIAKGIFHIEGDPDLGPEQSDTGFAVETTILAQLPEWWGIRLLNAFRTDRVRVVVTPELPTRPWRTHVPSVDADRAVAAALGRQLRYLHSQHVAHRDLELKNVMLTPAGPVIIDFEKATMEATTDEMRTDWEKLVGSLREYENTRRIGDFLAATAPMGRRMSVGGSRKQRRTRRYKRTRSRRVY
jgi:tRNA A-37 threonylcarbamoyl transferase component Bud32